MKKRVLSAALVLAMMASLASCSGGDSSSSSASEGSASAAPSSSEAASSESASEESASASAGGETVELTYWYAWTDQIQECNENLTAQFNEGPGAELGIHVTAEYQGSYDDVHQKLQAAYVAGDTPDVTVMEIGSVGTFARNGVLTPIDDYIERDGVDMSDFYSGLLENCEVDGSYYGLPYLRSTPILYMNTTMLESAGLDPAGPQNWDELADYCRTIYEQTGKYGLTMYSYVWTFEAFMMQQGTSVLNEDETACNIDSEECREVLHFFQDLANEGVIRCIAGEDSSRMDADYMNQNAAMWFNSTANLTNAIGIGEENGFDVNVCYMPAAETYGVPTGGCNLIIPASLDDTHKDAAWEFVKWMTATDQSAYASAYTGYVPNSKSASETATIQDLWEETPQFEVAVEQLELYAQGRPKTTVYAQVEDELVAMMDACWVNGEDVDTVAAETAATINDLLASAD